MRRGNAFGTPSLGSTSGHGTTLVLRRFTHLPGTQPLAPNPRFQPCFEQPSLLARSSSKEVRIRVPLFSEVYSSRGILLTKKAVRKGTTGGPSWVSRYTTASFLSVLTKLVEHPRKHRWTLHDLLEHELDARFSNSTPLLPLLAPFQPR